MHAPEPDASTALAEAVGVSKRFVARQELFSSQRGVVHALQDVSVQVAAQETLGLVGESGSGKSTLGRVMLRLLEPDDGRVRFEGQDITRLSFRQMQAVRRKAQMIFQDPYGSLNPRMTVRQAIAEVLHVHKLASSSRDADEQIAMLLQRVGLRPEHRDRYPHEFSGGQRQRIGIARALAVRPKFIVADEPISALDVSVQAQIVNLLQELQHDLGLSYLFIAHDLRIVRFLSHRIAVLYLGRIVEQGPSDEVYHEPRHPYTQALLQAVPTVDLEKKRVRLSVSAEAASPSNLPTGCAFHPRCPLMIRGTCDVGPPPAIREVAQGHAAACHAL
jgi:oligopeptide/dipeptide ABC transporter ATP-binding protein